MSFNAKWKAGGISVAGFSHIEEGIPCQDAYAFEIREDGWLVGAVSDGAGSASMSHIGAEAYVSAVVRRFSDEPELATWSSEKMAATFIDEINATSLRLVEQHADEGELEQISKADFAATFVMLIANEAGGHFLHVGDGAGAALTLSDMESVAISKPENGQYANETYFVTMDAWEEHLRVTPFGAAFDTVLLMSDGVTPMAMTKGCEAPFPSFVGPVIEYLLKTELEKGQAALENTLSREQVRAVTGDDKTLFWASILSSADT